MSSPSPLTPPALDNLTTLEKVETAALYLLQTKKKTDIQNTIFGNELFDLAESTFVGAGFVKNTFLQYLSILSKNLNSKITCQGKRQGYYLTNTVVAVPNPAQSTLIASTAKQRVQKESKLYQILVRELLVRGYNAENVANGRLLGKWGNPDVAGIKTTFLIGTCSTSIEIVTVEVKVKFDDWERDIFEAVSHRRFANRAYFAFACPDAFYVKLPLPEMRYYAELFKIGILVILLKDDDFEKLDSGQEVSFDDDTSDTIDVIEINSAPYEYVQPKYQQEFCEALKIKTPHDLYEWGQKPPDLL